VIALDTSSICAFLAGETGSDVDAVDAALADMRAVLPPVVVSELLSSPHLRPSHAAVLVALPRVPLVDGYWDRAGYLRARQLARGHKSRLADALIAQACIDARLALVTRDRDFRHYVPAGLRLARV